MRSRLGSAFPLGVTTVTCTGRDVAGNTDSKSFTVTVYDAENPQLTLPPSIVRPVDEGQNTAVVNCTATATDNSGSVYRVPPSGSAFALGTTTVTCNAVDNAGNVSSGSFTVTVTNSIIPPCFTAASSLENGPLAAGSPDGSGEPLAELQANAGQVLQRSHRLRDQQRARDRSVGGQPRERLGNHQHEEPQAEAPRQRDDNGNGHIYTITVEGKDKKGNVYLCSTTVSVPKNAPPKTKGGKK